MEPSRSDLLRRVRWGNVAPFAVIVVAGGALLLAPRAAPEPAAAPPVAVQPGSAVQREARPEVVEEEPVAARPKARAEQRREARPQPARSRHRPRRRRPARRARRVAPAVPTTAPPPGPAWSPPPGPTPEQLEFAPLG